MAKYKHPLSSVKIASPCSADWENMFGNDRRRFCGQCELNVYNLSDMTKREAEELINQTEGRLCVRFFRREDGTILTRDCPVGLKAIRRRVSRLAKATLSAVIGFISGLGMYGALHETDGYTTTMGVMAQELPERGNGLPIPEVEEVQGNMIRPGYQYEEGKVALTPIKKVRIRSRSKR